MIMDSLKRNTQLPDFSKDNIRIVFIGCGKISYFHYDVFKALGIRIVAAAARKNSSSLAKFITTHKEVIPYEDYAMMIRIEKPDAIIVMPRWDQVEKVLYDLLEFDIPKLVEKPIATSADRIESLIKMYSNTKSNILVGYNRRFYDFIPEIKLLLASINISAVEIHIPESSNGISDMNLLDNLFVQNSSHVIDTFYYLFNSPAIHIERIKKLSSAEKNRPAGYNAFLSANNIPIHLIANWNSPSNFGIKFHSENLLVEILPLEIATIYNGFEIIEPTNENPIRKYKPKVKTQYFISDISAKFKPGFFNQAINFTETSILCNRPNIQGATLKSTLEITKFCSKIINGEYN